MKGRLRAEELQTDASSCNLLYPRSCF